MQGMTGSDPAEELRRIYPPILTTAQVAEMLQCTIGDVRDKVHARKVPAMRWGQQFRFFRDEVIAAMTRVDDQSPGGDGDIERDEI
jgi:excisionase family DNA binding protein